VLHTPASPPPRPPRRPPAPEVKAEEEPPRSSRPRTARRTSSPRRRPPRLPRAYEVTDGVSADVQALREAHANQPVLEVLPTHDAEETQSEVLERLSRERKAQQLASDLVPDNAAE
jgi:hypothetical protein